MVTEFSPPSSPAPPSPQPPQRRQWLRQLLPLALTGLTSGDWLPFANEAPLAVATFYPSSSSTATQHQWSTAVGIGARQMVVNVRHYLGMHRTLPPERLATYAGVVVASELQHAVVYAVSATTHPQQQIARSTTSEEPCPACKSLAGTHDADFPSLYYWHPYCACVFKAVSP